MSDNKLEKQFRDKIDGHISPIDSDALWSDIQNKRAKKESFGKKRIILFLLLGLLFAGGAFYCISTSSGHSEANGNSIANTNEISTTNTNANKNNSERLNSNSVESKSLEFDKIQESEKPQSNVETAILNQTSKSNGSIQTKKSYDVTPRENKSSTRLNTQQSPKLNTIQNDNTKHEVIQFESNEASSPLNHSNQEVSKDAKEKLNSIEASDQSKSQVNTKLIADQSSWLTDKIESLELSLLNNDIAQPYSKRTPIKTSKRGSKFDIGATFNYEYAFRNLNSLASDSTSFGPAYAELRSDSEKFVESYRAGIFLRYNFKNNFRASLGFEYAQLTERFENNTLLSFEFRNDLSTNFVPARVDSVRVQKIHNRYSSINIPINIGKSFGSKKLSYFIDLGALINISFESSGQIFSSNEKNFDFLDLEGSSETAVTDLLQVSYMIHAGLSYQLDDKSKIELGPQFHSSFQPEFRINSIESKRNYIGLRFNLVRSF